MRPQLIDIPAAGFLLGNDAGRPDERPRHRVRLAAFRAAPRPLSNADYLRFVAATAAPPPPFLADPRFVDPAAPVVGVNWFDAVAYCRWLSAVTGLPLRLPSEAEREYAARGVLDGADWPWGAGLPQRRLPAIADLARPHRPRPACANGFGLLCMAENVHEWCSDWYHPRAYAGALDGADAAAPPRPHSGRRVSRGGSWRHALKFTRVSARSSLDPAYRYNDYGFRIYADAAGAGGP